MKCVKLLTVVLCVAMFAVSVNAADQITGVTATGPTVFGERAPQKAVDGSGLVDGAHGVAPDTMYLAGNDAFLNVDLGGWYTLDQLKVWNYNEAGPGYNLSSRGFKDTTISAWTGTGWVNINTVLSQAPGAAGYNTPDTVAVGFSARNLLISQTSGWGDNDYKGLSEVQFFGTATSNPEQGITGNKIMSLITTSVSTEFPGRLGINTVNGSGMTGDAHDVNPEAMWLTVNGITNQWIAFDFGTVKELSGMKVWNYNENGSQSRGIKSADFQTSTDGINWTTVMADRGFKAAPGTAGYADPTLVNLLGVDTRYFRINALSNFGDVNYLGLSEVQFYEVPEPVTMCLFGLGSLLVIRRKRA